MATNNEPVQPETADAVPEGHRRPSSAETERPLSGQRPKEEDHGNNVEADVEDDDTDDDPAVKIKDLDWKDLEQRYHDRIGECETNETQLLQEFDQLMDFFRVWSESGSRQETERTYKRLRTRMAHVQHSEQSLEEKRQHYNKVVDAFKSALQLLQGQFRV